MADLNTNTCAICMDSLWSGEPVGAYAPCGHVFHVQCGEEWRRSRAYGDCRCPLCNASTASFCRIFIDATAIEQEDDDLSLSDDEAENDEYQMESEAASAVEQIPLEDNDQMNDEEKMNVITIDDDEENDKPTTKTTECLSSNESASISSDRYKKKAKHLKRTLTALQAKHDKTLSTLHGLRDTCQELQERIDELESEQEDLEASNHQQQLELEGMRLEKAKLARNLDEHINALHAAVDRAKKAESSLKTAREEHQILLKRESKNKMSELEQIVADSRKLKEDNRQLKTRLDKCERARDELLEASRKRSANQLGSHQQIPEATPTHRQDRPRKIAKALSQMHQAHHRESGGRRPATTSDVEPAKQCYGIVSENAIRMKRASDKVINSSSSNALKLLNDDGLHGTEHSKENDKRTTDDHYKKLLIPKMRVATTGSSRPRQQTLKFHQR
ncbi:hypothetical protein MPSEU_000954400 [Mayamaea pseudoterrestris]|nr:hypothetical protein MPSEU_000954400 [Mayamaea pseudoterrestris]